MKKIFLLALLFTTLQAGAQIQPDSLSFCHIKYKTPEGCNAKSEFQVDCNEFSMQWIYMTEEMLQTIPDQLIAKLEEQMKSFKKEEIHPKLLGETVKGYKVSYPLKEGYTYQVIAYGKANGQPVLVQLTLGKNPKSNEDIPEFPRQIILIND